MPDEYENLSDGKLRQAHCNLYLRYDLTNEREIMMQDIEVVQEMARRRLKHQYADRLDRMTINQLARRRRGAKKRKKSQG